MSGFNPDQYLAEKSAAPKAAAAPSAPAFDPDAYLSAKGAPKAVSGGDAVGAAIEGFGQGASLGYLPELQALVGQLVPDPNKDLDAQLKAQGFDIKQGSDSYVQLRDENVARQKALADSNPGTYNAAQIAGAIATAPAAEAAVAKALPAAASATMLRRAAVTGAALAGAANPGSVEGEISPIQAKERLENAAMGGALGLGLAGAAPVVGAAAKRVGGSLKESAEKLAARALGAERGTIKKLGMDKVLSAGRQALDEGIVSPLASTEDMIERNAAVKAKGAGKMNEAYDAIDKAGASTFDPLAVATDVENQIGGFYRSPINRGETNQLDNTLDAILMRSNKIGPKGLPLKDAQELKQELAKVANWKNNLTVTDKERMARDAYKIVSDAIDKATEDGAKSIGTPGLKEALTEGRRLYSGAKAADELLTNRLAREQGNNLMSLSDTGLGATVGAATGAALPTAGAIVAKKALGRFGAGTAATAFDAAGNLLARAPKAANAIGNQSSKVVQASGEYLRPKLPRNAGRRVGDADEEPKKGPAKWANDGFKKVREQEPDLESMREALMNDKEGRRLLIEASSLTPGSKAMKATLERIKRRGASLS